MIPALRNNLVQLLLLVGDLAPAPLVSGAAYRSLRRRLSSNPRRYDVKSAAPPFTPGAWRERNLAGPETDLVIEGFPGSANSFVSNSVRTAIDRSVRIESHFHYTVQLRRARAKGVPTVVMVRRPVDACDSLKTKNPRTWDWLIVLRWLLYYRYVERYRDQLTVIDFDRAIADVDFVRRSCPAVAALAARPLAGELRFRRPGRDRVRIKAEKPLIRWLLRRATARHARLIEGRGDCSHPG